MKNFVFHNTTKVIFGKGQVETVGEQVAAIGGKILLVTGEVSVKKTGLLDRVKEKMTMAGVEFVELSGIKPNPEIDSVRRGAAICKESGVDAVLALGGGSVIDASKVMAAGAVYDGDPWDFFEKKIKPANPLPVGVVLTISATGSEANGNAVVTNPAVAQKRAMYHPLWYPRFSILDPELTYTVPADQTAFGAVDILSHVFEQYFHDVDGTDLQDGFAETIMRSVIQGAKTALDDPDDYGSRANLMWGSTLALNGVIGAGAQGDWTCHMLGHELSAKYGLSHGAALAVVFPGWMKFMAERKTSRFVKFAKAVWNVDPKGKNELQTALEGIEATVRFFRDTLKVGVTLEDYGIGGEKIELMADAVIAHKGVDALGGLKRNDLIAIYKSAMG